MIVTEKITIKKNLPFNADYVENELQKLGYNALRWSVSEVSEDFFIIDAAIIKED